MRSQYKILHTTYRTKWDYVEKRILNESVWMEENGHSIIIAAPTDTPLFLKAKAHGFKVYGIDFKRLSAIKDYKFLKRIFYNEKPDIINTHGTRDSKLALLAAKKAEVPLRILSRHNDKPVRNSFFNRKIYKKYCHYIFTTSDDTTKYIKKKFKLKDMQIFSISNGIIEPDNLIQKNEARILLAQELDLDINTQFIGFVGKQIGNKDISTLFEAFRNIKNSLDSYHVAIIGDIKNEYKNYLKKLATNLQISNQIHFLGFKENIWPYYRAIDCKILPEKNVQNRSNESVPLNILEAMICKCPVIGSKNTSLVDVIDHEKTGLLYEPSNSSDLSDKILKTVQNINDTNERIQNAFDFAKNNHTIASMGRDINRIYRLHQVKLERHHFKAGDIS